MKRCCRRYASESLRGSGPRETCIGSSTTEGPQEQEALGGYGAPVLQTVGRAGRLRDGGEPVARQYTGHTDRLATVPADGLSRRPGPTRVGQVRQTRLSSRRSRRSVCRRDGTNDVPRSRFATVRVRTACPDYSRSQTHEPEWLPIELPEGGNEPLKHFLSTTPECARMKQWCS